jgi:hypothetical protein
MNTIGFIIRKKGLTKIVIFDSKSRSNILTKENKIKKFDPAILKKNHIN